MSTLDRRTDTSLSAPALPNAGSPAPETAPRKSWLRLLRLPALMLAAIGIALVVNWYFQVWRFLESTDNATIQGDIAILAARVEGHVAAILVADNQHVTAGEPLIQLEDRDWRARLAAAEAAVSAAAAAVETADRQVTQQDAAITQADAALQQARAEAVRARADAGRASSLVGGGWTSRQALDRAEADTRKADAGVTAAEAAIAAARAQKTVLEAIAAERRAAVAQARSAAELARIDLDNTVIRAPFAGQVGNRAAQLGQYVRAGTNLIALAPETGALFVVANFKETQLARMHRGQPVAISVDALGTTIPGHVDSMAPATGALFSLLPPEN
ncbi:MAG: HlyD family secretion protein, partial [Acetobacteraceae bacterium]|nr:HlyD family secretion protein [Acetobacteraceae bacterium]